MMHGQKKHQVVIHNTLEIGVYVLFYLIEQLSKFL